MGTGSFNVFGVRISTGQLIMVVIAVILMIALDTLVRRTRSGRAMRAISQDPRPASSWSVNVDSVIARTFFLGSALAGAAGVMAGAYYGKIDFLMGFIIRAQGLHCSRHRRHRQHSWRSPAVPSCSASSSPSAPRGSGVEWRDVFAFGFLILFLTVRPTGLLGETSDGACVMSDQTPRRRT